jgi:uroporphyrinogen-III decarboxylase
MRRRTFAPQWDKYQAWTDAVGDLGVVYLPAGYSALGQLMNYWMGPEQVVYATVDCPDLLREVVDSVNDNNLELIDLLAQSPAEVIIMGDNFSSDLQPPAFFEEWSARYYAEAVRRLHATGKCVAVHIDGRLRGALRMIRDTGADCGDAITPTPMGDLTPAECRAEAGPEFILSGGVSPDLWLPNVPVDVFTAKVREWLELRHVSPRLIANAGDQVPPGADEDRIRVMRDLVERYGTY